MDTTRVHTHCSAMIVAAGSSQRMGFDKLAQPLGGLPVLLRTLHAFLAAESISDIVLVCPPERWFLLGDDPVFPKPVKRVDGGSSRQESVAAGLAALPDEARYVAVHDGARPLVTPHDIDRCVQAAREHRAAALARRVTETLKRADGEDFSTNSLSRDHLWFMETPQTFELELLRNAYALVITQGHIITDEVSAMEIVRVPVKLIESTSPNLKVTTPADLALAAALLK